MGQTVRVPERGADPVMEEARRALDPVYGALADVILEIAKHGPGPRAQELLHRVSERALEAARDPYIRIG
jgi:hypothetical protein